MANRITGYHAIEEALKQAPAGSVLFLCRNSERRNERLESLAKAAGGKVIVRKIAKVELDRMVPDVDHRGAMLEIQETSRERRMAVKAVTVKDFAKGLQEGQGAVVLMLDGITDVQNLGAIMRSADQFSVDLVVVPERRSAQADATVAGISSGASQYVPTATVVNLVREIEILKEHGFWVYGADMAGEALPSVVFPKRTVIVMGSEGDGLSQLVAKSCDHIVSIPTNGHIDSLNVSVAAGVLLYEARRQQLVRT